MKFKIILRILGSVIERSRNARFLLRVVTSTSLSDRQSFLNLIVFTGVRNPVIVKAFFIIFLLLLGCDEKKPEFYPELTNASTPIEGVLPYFKGNVMDPYWSENGTFPEDLKRLPNFSLLSHSNNEVNRDKLLGKYTLVTFFYAKCKGICPMITANMVKFLPSIEKDPDIQIISFSVNPEEDSVEVLQKFRKQYKITNENWIFLTGSKKTIYDIARKEFSADVKVIKGQDDLNDFVHTENVYLLDKKQYLRGIYRAKGTGDLERLLVEFKTLKAEDTKTKSQ
ncbi:MAG: SCO family protein [Leptospiraceae bacterium]|nr:SCO family protein [Leptospiraceae bacterium]